MESKTLASGQEGDLGSPPAGLARALQVREGLAPFVGLLPGVAVAPDLQVQRLGKRVNHRHAHAVQAARDFVAVGVELAARMEHRHHHFGGRAAFVLVQIDGDAAPVVNNGNRIVGMDGDVDAVAITRQRLVHGVVHHFPYQVVQARLARGTDVHGRPLTHRLQVTQNLDTRGIVCFACAVIGRLLLRHSPP